MNLEGTRFRRELSKKLLAKRSELLAWYQEKAQIAPPPFYLSVDLRDSGHKIAPVDCNLYPAGFNNLCSEDIRTAPAVIRSEILKEASSLGLSDPQKILILPESHTSNTYYIENLAQLSDLIREAGFEVQVGWYVADLAASNTNTPIPLKSVSGRELQALPIEIPVGGVLSAGGFVPDLILINNDFSAGYPKVLDAVVQPMIPSHRLGWHTRKKSEHFFHYNNLAAEFAQIAGIDPWVVQIDTQEVAGVNFNEELGTDRVVDQVQQMLVRTQTAYERHQIGEPPFVFVKNNAGTYGMGIMVVHSADEITQMNRRTKNKMSVGKGKAQIESVVVQEGIPTQTRFEKTSAEPVIYMVGCELIGGFLRTNPERGDEDNLNSAGMVFKRLCMSDLRDAERGEMPEAGVLEIVYGAIARISALAAGLEIKAHLPMR